MKLKYTLILALLFCTTQHAHAGPPGKKIIEKILGTADEVDVPKKPSIPNVPSKPLTGSTPSGSATTGTNPGILDNLDDLTLPKPKPVIRDFVDVRPDVEAGTSSTLPFDFNHGTDIDAKPPTLYTPRPGNTGVREAQDIVIKPKPASLIEGLNSAYGTNFPEPTVGASPKVTVRNHSYYDPYDPNCKIIVKVGSTEYVIGFVPGTRPGVPDFADGGATFPAGQMIRKSEYDSILKAGKDGYNGYRMGEGGIIQI